MLKIGLTGGIASGKTTVSKLFEDKGITIIDADIIARQIVEPDTPCYEQILSVFGNDIVQTNRELDRKKLRQRIFTSPEDKRMLESILHPVIRTQLIEQSNQADSMYCILSIPLLIESSMEKLVDRTLVIDISPHIQLQRLCLRDDISETLALNIIRSQCARQARISAADDIIRNDFFNEELRFQVDKLHENYRLLSKDGCHYDDSNGQ